MLLVLLLQVDILNFRIRTSENSIIQNYTEFRLTWLNCSYSRSLLKPFLKHGDKDVFFLRQTCKTNKQKQSAHLKTKYKHLHLPSPNLRIMKALCNRISELKELKFALLHFWFLHISLKAFFHQNPCSSD